MNTMSTMNLISENVSSKKKSLFQGIINVGYDFPNNVHSIICVIWKLELLILDRKYNWYSMLNFVSYFWEKF